MIEGLLSPWEAVTERKFDVPNTLMLQKISHCLHKVEGGDQAAGNNKQNRESRMQFHPFSPVSPCQILDFSRFPLFFDANAPQKIFTSLRFPRIWNLPTPAPSTSTHVTLALCRASQSQGS